MFSTWKRAMFIMWLLTKYRNIGRLTKEIYRVENKENLWGAFNVDRISLAIPIRYTSISDVEPNDTVLLTCTDGRVERMDLTTLTITPIEGKFDSEDNGVAHLNRKMRRSVH